VQVPRRGIGRERGVRRRLVGHGRFLPFDPTPEVWPLARRGSVAGLFEQSDGGSPEIGQHRMPRPTGFQVDSIFLFGGVAAPVTMLPRPGNRPPRDRVMTDTTAPPPGLLYSPPPADMPIPNRLNVALVVLVVAAAVGLLWLGSWVERW